MPTNNLLTISELIDQEIKSIQQRLDIIRIVTNLDSKTKPLININASGLYESDQEVTNSVLEALKIKRLIDPWNHNV